MQLSVTKKDLILMVNGTHTADSDFLPFCYNWGSTTRGGCDWDEDNLNRLTMEELYKLYKILSSKKKGLYLTKARKAEARAMLRKLAKELNLSLV